MILDIEEVFRKGAGYWEETVEIPRIVNENVQVKDLSPMTVSVKCRAVDSLCQADANVQTVVSYVCSRCLCIFDENLETDFREDFSLRQVPGDDVHFVPQDKVPFNPYIEQAVNLAINPLPLCRQDCLGLCPECGVNLNERKCDCRSESVDPRLEALRGLLSEDKSE